MCVRIVPLLRHKASTTIHKWEMHSTHPIQNRRLKTLPGLNSILLESTSSIRFSTLHPCLEITFAEMKGLFAFGEGDTGSDAGPDGAVGVWVVPGEGFANLFEEGGFSFWFSSFLCLVVV